MSPATAALYEFILARGEGGTAAYYECLRSKGILPSPGEGGDLYAPNPVIVSGDITRWMTEDINAFAEHRRQATRDGADLLALMPAETRAAFASPDVAPAL